MRIDEQNEASQQPLIASAALENRETLLRGAFLQRFPPHVELIREGDPADFLHVIVEGQVEVFSHYRDRETTVAVLGPSDTFILAAVILDRPYLKSARALCPSRILMLPASAIRSVFAEDAGFARAIAFGLATAYRGVVKELKNQKLRSSLERLANWLIRHDSETGATRAFDLPFDKKVLASRLGMAPEVLSRTLVTLQAYGVVVEGRRVKIGNHAALLKLAGPATLIDDPTS